MGYDYPIHPFAEREPVEEGRGGWLGLTPNPDGSTEVRCCVVPGMTDEQLQSFREAMDRKIDNFVEGGPERDGGWTEYPHSDARWQTWIRYVDMPWLD